MSNDLFWVSFFASSARSFSETATFKPPSHHGYPNATVVVPCGPGLCMCLGGSLRPTASQIGLHLGQRGCGEEHVLGCKHQLRYRRISHEGFKLQTHVRAVLRPWKSYLTLIFDGVVFNRRGLDPIDSEMGVRPIELQVLNASLEGISKVKLFIPEPENRNPPYLLWVKTSGNPPQLWLTDANQDMALNEWTSEWFMDNTAQPDGTESVPLPFPSRIFSLLANNLFHYWQPAGPLLHVCRS